MVRRDDNLMDGAPIVDKTRVTHTEMTSPRKTHCSLESAGGST